MPFTKRQIERILDFEGKPVIRQGDQHHLAVQVAESFIRRRLFRHEDETARAQFKAMKRAQRDIRISSHDLGELMGIRKLASGRQAVTWRRAMMAQVVRPRLAQLSRELALMALSASIEAWLASYFGRGWLMDMATRPDVRVNVPIPSRLEVARQVLALPLREQFEIDQQLLQSLLGQNFEELFGIEVEAALAQIQISLNTSIQAGEGIEDAMRRLANVLGVNIDDPLLPKALYNRIQTITRTTILDASNQGVLAVYNQNSDIVAGAEWLAANDSRVCPICLGLNGEIWGLNDPDLRVPPRDSHPNCRCTLIPVLLEATLIANDEPPSMTFSEWLVTIGGAFLLNDFMSGRAKDSSRIGNPTP